MKLEKQVCSLKLAKKLKELGVKQESLFYWWRCYADESDKEIWNLDYGKYYKEDGMEGMCSAFTVAELGEMLPESIDNEDGLWEKIWSARTQFGEWRIALGESHFEKAKTEAEARAKMLIYLINNKLIKLNKNNE